MKTVHFPLVIEGVGEVRSWPHLKTIARSLGLSNGFIASHDDLIGAVTELALRRAPEVRSPG